ncbi:BlaI/MecI/CopY family transcriptional regulator [Paenibacillus flagellatus]|uniref:CopY family transcriptional regulator n=1 Tax=Paenibacillus flagellatus TaxID=2211139 RepID=A0A2V5K2S7_9BACL|nr:BlaI/MecI/CopY family transcriptional regulator [Paenibacillus flagellatus]PYI52084.1 CopY family transcriptional regulator [Paenibacillus flagellatus]
MTKWQRMSEAERQIMDIIWASDRPLTTSEIIRRLPEEKAWKQNTVITFLARLSEKGIVSAERIGKAHHYKPSVNEQEYVRLETKQFVRDVHKGSVFGLVSALCDNGDLTKDDIESLMKRLKEE